MVFGRKKSKIHASQSLPTIPEGDFLKRSSNFEQFKLAAVFRSLRLQETYYNALFRFLRHNSLEFPKIMVPNIQKSQPFREIKVSVSAFLEAHKQQTMVGLLLPSFKLHDFSDQEECKVIKMMFAYAGIPYEFKGVHRDEFILEDYPFYALPMLEINEKKLGSVLSICRQLGWRYEMSGQTAQEDSLLDAIAEKTYEARMRLKNWLDHLEHMEHHECDETCSSTTAIYVLENGLLPTIEAVLRTNGSWLVGSKMTWGDLLTACLFNPIAYHCPQIFDNYPLIYLHTKRIAEMYEFKGFLYHMKNLRSKSI